MAISKTAAYQRAKRQVAFDAGLCHVCGEPRDGKWVCCLRCRRANRVAQAASKRARLAKEKLGYPPAPRPAIITPSQHALLDELPEEGKEAYFRLYAEKRQAHVMENKTSSRAS